MKPRALILVTLAETGGAQTYVRELVPALTGSFDVVVGAYGPGPLGDGVRAGGGTFVPLQHVRRPIAPLRDLRGLVELWQLCRRVRPTVVHTNSSKAGILGRIAAAAARVPVRLFTAHGWAFKASGGRSSRVYLWADRLALRLTTAVICVSEEERRAGLAAGTCRADRTHVIYNGVAGVAHERRREDGTGVRIVSIGRLAEPKDFETLLHAFAAVDGGTTLTILGDGPQRGQLEELAGKLGVADAVTFAGDVLDVPRRLAEADVFVLSSRSEGLPLSVLEAMAAGLPCVASSVGGIPEIVREGETGFLVPPADPAALAERLSQLVSDPALRAAQGAASRARVEQRFSLAEFRAQHLALYERLAAAAA